MRRAKRAWPARCRSPYPQASELKEALAHFIRGPSAARSAPSLTMTPAMADPPPP
ncbi:Hypothetical protein A7982_09313 [Minicystis rosea]|nr:Hypothetical protein A7982_09313 [Minicystis rosea]